MGEFRIAVIGGGASATLLLAQLGRLLNGRACQIDVFDRAGQFAKGIAYSTPSICHLLNVRASNMSALADEPEDFSKWAESKGYGPNDFVPRLLYGTYLTETLGKASKVLDVSFILKDVLNTSVGEDGTYNLETEEGITSYQVLVQATGNCVPLRPRLEGSVSGYYDSPWEVPYEELRQAKKVILIGSGLSAADAILALHAHEYTGEIVVCSRHALFPAVHIAPQKYEATWLQKIDIPSQFNTPRQALRNIRSEVRSANVPWQMVIDSLRPHTNDIWKHWSPDNRDQFMHRVFTFWNLHRHRMAPEVFEVLDGLEKNGRLQRIKTRVRAVRSAAFSPVVITDGVEIEGNAVINCLGYRYHERTYATSFVIGPPCFGPLFETTAIPEIRMQASVLAKRIADLF